MGSANPRFRFFALSAALLVAVFVAAPVAAVEHADFDIPNGHFFTQTGGGDGNGYAVTDADGIPYWASFTQLGGVATLGYPVSRRFTYKGFTNMAFQKAILQWQPNLNSMNFLNIFDELSASGKDADLEATKLTPKSRDWSGDVGLPWGEVVQRHLALLNENSAIKSKFLADPDWLNHKGLPMGYEDLGDVRVLRAQRSAFQQWMIEVPWAKAGEVVVANGGDIAKELGLIPQAAAAPHASDETTGVLPEEPVAPPTTYTASAGLPQLTTAEIVELNRTAIFRIETDNSCASGFFVNPDGYAVTNNHAVRGFSNVTATLADGRTVTAEVLAADGPQDLALLKLPGTGNSYVLFGASSDMPLGGDLVTMGFPVTLEGDSLFCSSGITVTRGILSNRTTYQENDYLQTDAAINPGNSGGAAFDLTGAFIGIPTAGLDPARMENVGFMIPSDRARPIVDGWIAGHRAGTLGGEASPIRLVYERDSIRCAHAGDAQIENVPIVDGENFVIEYVVAAGSGIGGVDFRGTPERFEYVIFVGPFFSNGIFYDIQLRVFRADGHWEIRNINSGLVPRSTPFKVKVEVNGFAAQVWVNDELGATFEGVGKNGQELGMSCINYTEFPTVSVDFQDIRIWRYE